MLDMLFPSIAALVSLSGMAVVFGLILSVAKITMRVEKDPRIELINQVLPGANCGACGMPGCSGYAAMIVTNGFELNMCPVGGAEVVLKIAEIMGRKVSVQGVPMKARVHCHGGFAETTKRFLYEGPRDCQAAHHLMRGFKVCEFGCLGLGDCAFICPFDAITMSENSLPVINKDRCTGCNKCVTACPRNIISLVPENFEVFVMCRNTEKPAQMRKGCSVGCTGCKLCERICKEVLADKPDTGSAITVNNFCASIDYDKCINCFSCAEVCPVPVIEPVHLAKKAAKKKEAAAGTEAATEVVERA